MPQFNNYTYNALQFQSNKLSNGFNESNRNLTNANGYLTLGNTNNFNGRTNHNTTHSPSAVLTPGRKSASPTFFHSNDTLYNNLGVFLNSAHSNKHLNGLNGLQSQFPYSNFNGPQLTLANNQESALNIPTTPTRSKSLSPSHRCINQPARLRHKQQNKNSKNQDPVNQVKNKLDDKKADSNNENFFQPIDNYKTKNENYIIYNTLEKRAALNLDSKPSKLNDLNDKVQIKKPIPVLPICHKTELAHTKLSTNQVHNKLQNDTQKVFTDKFSTEKDKSKIQNDFHGKNLCENKNKNFKLPFNVRMINLNNYPPNISPIAKRQFSVIMQRVKSESLNNSDKCIQILKQNIQLVFNEEIKQLVDKIKQNFIYPAVKNFNHNKNDSKISEEDMLVIILSLIEDAKKSIYDPESKNSTLDEPIKRKLHSESSDDFCSDLSDESVRKKCKNLSSENKVCGDEKNEKKEFLFDLKTKFVLGKNVNDVFIQIQQQFYEVNSEDSNSSATLNDSINPKSIYARFPNLFRYEADQHDRQWLSENQIIKRRNIKCNILLLDDIQDLFKNNFKINSNITQNETTNDNRQESNDTQDERDLIFKKLKSFTLPEFILNKLNKNYNIKNSKFV